MASPLHILTTKNTTLVWDDKYETAFSTLKELLVSVPILAYPTRNDVFILHTDATNDCTGAVLSQIQNGEEKIIAYGCKSSKTHR